MKTLLGGALAGAGLVLFKYESNWLEALGVVLLIAAIILIAHFEAKEAIDDYKKDLG
jgi:multidrug transporter EmrE-like cation transporter